MLKRILNSPYLLIGIVGLYPALFFASNNWFMYRNDQLLTLIILSPIMTLIFGIVIYLIFYGIMKGAVHFFSVDRRLSYLDEFKNAFFTLYSCVLLFFLFQSVHREIIANTYLGIIATAFITILIGLGVRKVGLAVINFPLVVVVVIACLQGGISYYSSLHSMSDSQWYTQNKTQNEKILFSEKPNVYLIILESYQNNSTLKEHYNFDNSEMTAEFTRQGFTIYDNVYSNYPATLSSLAALFTMQHHYYKMSAGKDDAIGARDIIGGRMYNPVLSVFHKNGYKIQFVSHSDYAFIAGPVIDYAYPERVVLKVFEIYQSEFLNDIFSRLFHTYRGKAGKKKNKDRIRVKKDRAYAEIKNRIQIAAANENPYFSVVKLTYPGHFSKSWNKIDTTSWYPEKIIKANSEIKDIVDHIINQDLDPFIILVGDHGAIRYRNVWKGKKDIHETLESRKISEATVAKDLFATFLAIKYPLSHDPKFKIFSHVNLFRFIFSALCQCNLPFDTRVADESYLRHKKKGIFITTRNGKPLHEWELLNRELEQN